MGFARRSNCLVFCFFWLALYGWAGFYCLFLVDRIGQGRWVRYAGNMIDYVYIFSSLPVRSSVNLVVSGLLLLFVLTLRSVLI